MLSGRCQDSIARASEGPLSARSTALGNGKKEGIALKARVNLGATFTCQTQAIDRASFISVRLVSRFQRLRFFLRLPRAALRAEERPFACPRLFCIAPSAPAVWTFPTPHNCIYISGRGGLNHGGVAQDVCWSALAEGFVLNLLTQECYRVLAGGTPSGIAPLG